MTTLFIIAAVIAGALAFLEYKRPGTVKGWIDSALKPFRKGP